MKISSFFLTAGAALALAACGNDGTSKVSLAVAVRGSNANALSAAVVGTPGASGLTLSDGTNTLVITTAEVVLREIELKRTDVTACAGSGGILLQQGLAADQGDDDPVDHDAGDDKGGNRDDDSDDDRDGCEKFETGPRLVSLPLDGGVSEQVIAAVPEGTYDRLEFEVHKLSDDNGSDILRDRPDLADASIRIVGTFNGASFVFVSDESFEQRVELEPPVVVGAGGSDVNVTLSIDIGKWFTNASGMLVDPNQVDDDIIEDGIDDSFACFEDDDRDGDDDDGDDENGDDDGDDDHGSDDDSTDDGDDDHGGDDDSTDDSGADSPGDLDDSGDDSSSNG